MPYGWRHGRRAVIVGERVGVETPSLDSIMGRETFPQLGFGLGLRTKHYAHIFEHQPAVDWFEIISENFMDTDGKPRRNLARIKERYPIVMHGVALSIGTVDPLNSEYLQKLKALIDWVNPAWVSDHLCWTGIAHRNTHDLLPVPYTEEALTHIVGRIKHVQDYLERPIALENPSTYLEFSHSSMPEAEFIARMAEDSGCHLLLDVNNVYVTCYNHRIDPKAYLDTLPLERVIQIHLSGHSNKGTHIIDTHDDHVIDDVWNLYKYVVGRAGRTPNTMVEWDDNIPEFPVLLAELEKARAAAQAPQDDAMPRLAQEQTPYYSGEVRLLADAQQHMQSAILLGDAFDSKPEHWIRAKEEFTPAEQLAVYTNAYRYRLYDVTAEDYPVLKAYLGNDAFHQRIWDFVNHVPPDHFNIARYALKLPEFIKTQLPQDGFAQELCELETLIEQLADLAETEALEQKHLAGMTPEALLDSVVYPRQALQLLTFHYPVNAYYQQVMDGIAPNDPAQEPSYLAVFRHEDIVWRMDLEEDEYRLISTLFRGETVGQALEAMDESIAQKLSGWFSRWICNGLLAAYEYKDEPTKRTRYEAA